VRVFRVIGVVLAIAGAATWVVAARLNSSRVSAEAQRLFESLGTQEEESPKDAATLVEISQATPEVRAAFLREALQSDAAADKMRLHEQGLSVALSQVNYSEAIELYQAAILPALKGSPGPTTLRECFALLSRWSLIGQISSKDADKIAERLTDQLTSPAPEETATLEQFAGAIAELATRLHEETATGLARKLFSRALAERTQAVIQTITRGLAALAPRLAPDVRRQLASTLVDRLTTERDTSVLLALAPTLAPLSATLDAKAAGEFAEKLSGRITAEFNTNALDALNRAFSSIAPKVDAAEAERISANLLRHVELEPEPAVLLLDTQALGAFGKKLTRRVYEEAAGSLLKRIHAEPSGSTLSVLAFCLGVFKDKAVGDRFFGDAASVIVSRFATEHDMQGLSALASAIDSVADHLDAAEAERLSSLLVTRLFAERNPGSVLYIAVGLESIADEARGPGAEALVRRLTERMREEHSSHVLRSLAFGAGAFTGVNGRFDAGAETLVARMEQEDDPDELHDLTTGLYALRKKTSQRWFDKAASILASRIQTQLDPGMIRALVASLHGLETNAGPEPFEQAATAMVANVNNFEALEPGLRRIAGKLRPEKAQELGRILAGRIAQEKDPKTLRVLGQGLADLPVDTSKVDYHSVLAMPQAPCDASREIGQLFNPRCGENSWNQLAGIALHAKAVAKEDLEPDFTQLAPDDDDDATTDNSVEAPALDFHQLSDALAGIRPTYPTVGEPVGLRWTGIGLFIMGLLTLLSLKNALGKPRTYVRGW
jgi:hypothetical protein